MFGVREGYATKILADAMRILNEERENFLGKETNSDSEEGKNNGVKNADGKNSDVEENSKL